MSAASDIGEYGEVSCAGMPAHFYLHVPFCRSKCTYCDFASTAGSGADVVFAVFAGMEGDLRRWSSTALPGVVETVYVGGGTPSLHAGPVGRLLRCAANALPLRNEAEITVEANPDSLTAGALEALVAGGANRVSVGVQAFDDAALRLLGRVHDARQARAALSLVQQAGVELSVDLMCGVPGQTMASWAESLEEALDAGARHVSVYPLTVEERTPLAAKIAAGAVADPDPDLAAEMMLLAERRLGEAGVARYEVANYAAPGHESRHNTAYWTGRSYVGIGPGAHGMLHPDVARTVGLNTGEEAAADDIARVRYANCAHAEMWLTGAPVETEVLSGTEAAREDVMLGMRTAAGVGDGHVASAGLETVLEGLAADGLVQHADGRWRTTQRGWLLGNEVFGRIWAGE